MNSPLLVSGPELSPTISLGVVPVTLGGTGLSGVGADRTFLVSNGTSLEYTIAVESVSAMVPLASSGGSNPILSIPNTTGYGSTVVLSGEPTLDGLTSSSFLSVQSDQDSSSNQAAIMCVGGIRFSNVYGTGSKLVLSSAQTPLLEPVFVNIFNGGVISAQVQFNPNRAATVYIDGPPTSGNNVSFLGTLVYALVVDGDTAFSGSLTLGGSFTIAGSTTFGGSSTFAGTVSMGATGIIPAAFITDIPLAPTPLLKPTRIFGYTNTIPPLEAWSLGYDSFLGNYSLFINNPLVPAKRVYIDSTGVSLRISGSTLIEINNDSTYATLNVFTVGEVLAGAFYSTLTTPYSGELAIYSDATLQNGAFMDKDNIALWENGVTPSIELKNQGSFNSLNIYGSTQLAASFYSTSSTPYSGELAIYSDASLQTGGFMDKDTLEFWGTFAGVPSRIISLEANNVFTGAPELSFYQGALATVTLNSGGLKIQQDASLTTNMVGGDFQATAVLPYMEIEYNNLVFSSGASTPVLTMNTTNISALLSYSVTSAQDLLLQSTGFDGTGNITLQSLGSTAAVSISALGVGNGNISLTCVGTTSSISLSCAAVAGTISMTCGGSASITCGVFSLTSAAGVTLTGGITTINFGATTINCGATAITLGATAITLGATTLTFGAMNLTAGVITAIAPVSVVMGGNAFSVTCGSGLIALSTGAGAIALSTGAGAIGITAGAGAVAITCGFGLMALTTLAGGLLISCIGGGIEIITTLGGTKLSCGSGNTEVSAALGSCYIYAPVGGIEVGRADKRNGNFIVYTTNGITAASTANVSFFMNSSGHSGPGNFLVDNSEAATGNVTFNSKGTILLKTLSSIQLESNGNPNRVLMDTSNVTATYSWRFPATHGDPGQFLVSGGSAATLEWQYPAAITALNTLYLTYNLPDTLTIGTTDNPGNNTGILVRNGVDQNYGITVIGIAGSISTSALVGDTVFKATKLLHLQSGEGGAAISISNLSVTISKSLTLTGFIGNRILITDSAGVVGQISSGSESQVLTLVGGIPSWVTPGGVTSVGLTVPSLFTVTGSPVTSSGTLGVGLVDVPTGSGGIVLQTSGTLITPDIGEASGTSLTVLTGTKVIKIGTSIHPDDPYPDSLLSNGISMDNGVGGGGLVLGLVQDEPDEFLNPHARFTSYGDCVFRSSNHDMVLGGEDLVPALKLYQNRNVDCFGILNLIFNNQPELLKVGSIVGMSFQPTSLIVQNELNKSISIGVCGTPGNFFIDSNANDTIIKSATGRILIGVGGGNSTVTIQDGVITLSGTCRVNGTFSQAPDVVFQLDRTGVPGGRFSIDGVGNGYLYGDLTLESLTASTLVYCNASNILSSVISGSESQILTMVGGVPTWTNFPPVTVLGVATGTSLTLSGTCRVNGTFSQAPDVVFQLDRPFVPGGRFSIDGVGNGYLYGNLTLESLTASTLVYCNASNILQSVVAGSESQILKIVGGLPTWADISYPASPTFVNPVLGVASGTSLTLGHGVGVLTVGSIGLETSPTSIYLRNGVTQALVVGISGGAGQFAADSIQGDAVIRTEGSRLLLGVGAGNSGVVINSEGPSVPRVIVSGNLASYSIGILQVINNNASPRGILDLNAPNMGIGQPAYIFLGRATSTLNCGVIGYINTGLGSSANTIELSVFEGPPLTVNGLGDVRVARDLFVYRDVQFGDNSPAGNGRGSLRLNNLYSQSPWGRFEIDAPGVVGGRMNVDLLGNVYMKGDLNLGGRVLSTVNHTVYSAPNTGIPTHALTAVQNWADGGGQGEKLTISALGRFTNNLGRIIYCTVSYSGRIALVTTGSTSFSIRTFDGSTEAIWATVDNNPSRFQSITSTVGLLPGSTLYFVGYQETGVGQDILDSKLTILIHK